MGSRTEEENKYEEYDIDDETTERTEHLQRQLDGVKYEVVLEVVQVHTAETLR